MSLLPFDNDKSANEYKSFYEQSGGIYIPPIYQGTKYQKGYGLGSIFSGLLKSAVPLLKKGAMALGKTAVKTGVNIAKDSLAGKNLKSAFKDNVKSAGKDLLHKSLTTIGNNVSRSSSRPRSNKRTKRKRPTLTSKQKTKAKRPRKATSDIFS